MHRSVAQAGAKEHSQHDRPLRGRSYLYPGLLTVGGEARSIPFRCLCKCRKRFCHICDRGRMCHEQARACGLCLPIGPPPFVSYMIHSRAYQTQSHGYIHPLYLYCPTCSTDHAPSPTDVPQQALSELLRRVAVLSPARVLCHAVRMDHHLLHSQHEVKERERRFTGGPDDWLGLGAAAASMLYP